MDPNGFIMDLDITDLNFSFYKKIQKKKFKNILEYPPDTNDQLKYSILEFLKSKYFHYPITFSLFK